MTCAITRTRSCRVLLTLLATAVTTCHGFSTVSAVSQVNSVFLKKEIAVNTQTRQGASSIANQVQASARLSNEDSAVSSSSSSSLANYHLLWSPKVLTKILLTTLFLWISIHKVPNLLNGNLQKLINIPMPTTSNSKLNAFLFNGLLPTLSSACCWIQMALNMVTAMGCAGFNTYLGPLRPFFLSILAYLTIATRAQTKPQLMALRWTIALLPELLHLWNTFTTRQSHRKLQSSSTDVPTTEVAVYLDCPTMGCVACIQNVNSSLQKALQSTGSNVYQIQAIDSWLLEGDRKGGKAKIRFSTLGDKYNKRIVSMLTRAMKRSGFPCTVDVVRATPGRT